MGVFRQYNPLPSNFAETGCARINGISIFAEANGKFVSLNGGIGGCLTTDTTTVGANRQRLGLFDLENL